MSLHIKLTPKNYKTANTDNQRFYQTEQIFPFPQNEISKLKGYKSNK